MSALSLLQKYSWPGNVRELRNAVEYACAFSDGPLLDASHLPAAVRAAGAASAEFAALRSLEEMEREHIARVLEATRYRIARAAEILGISRKTLLEKRKKYGLQ